MSLARALAFPLALAAANAACAKKSASNEAPPAQPSTGAPVAFVVDTVTPGPKGSLAVRAYNFSDKKIGGYSILMRYYDKGGAVLKVKPGTPFEQSYDSWSFMGRKYFCPPKSWCSFDIDRLEIPEAAVKAEVLAERLTAMKADDMHPEDGELFAMKEHEWPGASREPVTWPAPLAEWGDRVKLQAAWQGAWAGDGFGLGNTAAWVVEGTKVTFVDKSGEQTFELDIQSPCEAGFGGGKNGGWVSVFTLKDGQLITGLGDAGYRKGNSALVCGFGSVWLFDGTKCTKWENHFRRWESTDGKCGFKQEEGKEVFFYEGSNDGHPSILQVDGDTLWTNQLKDSHAQQHPDFAAAKAAQKL